MITLVTHGFASTQAIAICATETPCALAMGRIASTHLNARALSTTGKSYCVRRAPSGPLPSSLYLPESRPPASGLQTRQPSP